MRYPTRVFDRRSDHEVEHRDAFYHPELDILRFFAFFAVFLHHALPRQASFYIDAGVPAAVTQWVLTAKQAGAFGVDLFFALSAFLITELLRREYANRGTFGLKDFYVRRALRIWPLYFTFLAATVLVIPMLLPQEQFGLVYVISFALFVGNWVCATNGLPFSVASPLWSISVEEQFYFGWPLLLRLFGMKRIKQLALCMLGVTLLTRILLAFYEVKHPGVWCNTFARLDPIALGALLAFVLGGRTPQIRTMLRLALCVFAVAGWWLVARYLKQDGPTSVITYLGSAVASLVLLVAVLQRNTRLLALPPFTWLVHLGRISYGLYVFHLFALALVAKQSVPFGFEGRLVVSFLLTVLLAAVSYRWLEQPFLRLKKRFTYHPAREEGAARDGHVEQGVAGFARAS
jgi:peptidoglycan/LPS O-acetylase OafA/YrhL